MDAWVVWLVAAVVLGIGEMHQGAFYLGPFALAALLAAILSFAGVGVGLSAVAFIVAAVAVFVMLRPLVQRHRRLPPSLRTGASALIGRRALVLERIANDEGVGIVKIDGEVWTARSFDDDAVIEVGEKVEVVAIRGATALVMP
jgi:membrane protein implicated in regulation of membrane protease activity